MKTQILKDPLCLPRQRLWEGSQETFLGALKPCHSTESGPKPQSMDCHEEAHVIRLPHRTPVLPLESRPLTSPCTGPASPELQALWASVPLPSTPRPTTIRKPRVLHSPTPCSPHRHTAAFFTAPSRLKCLPSPPGPGPCMPAAHTACVTALSVSSGAVLSPHQLPHTR